MRHNTDYNVCMFGGVIRFGVAMYSDGFSCIVYLLRCSHYLIFGVQRFHTRLRMPTLVDL